MSFGDLLIYVYIVTECLDYSATADVSNDVSLSAKMSQMSHSVQIRRTEAYKERKS